MFILNAFSVGMLKPDQGQHQITVEFYPLTLEDAQDWAQSWYEQRQPSAVGHADTAALFTNILGVPVSHNRVTVELQPGTMALLGQYNGPRLPEGATSLPEGATIAWYLVRTVEYLH